jgi:hypothetical protein
MVRFPASEASPEKAETMIYRYISEDYARNMNLRFMDGRQPIQMTRDSQYLESLS